MLATIAASRRRNQWTPGEPPYNAETFLTIPTPDGSGRNIHPSVVDMGSPWNGYRYWQANTPYPGYSDPLENPCITASHDGIDWVVPDGLTNPIDPWPGGAGYNSDTELAYDPETGRMICFWRDYKGGSGVPDNLIFCASYSTNGVTWSPQLDLIEMTYPGTPVGQLSPAVLRIGPGDWRAWFFGSQITLYTAVDPLGEWSAPNDLGAVMPSWHGDVIRTSDGIYRAIYGRSIGGAPQEFYLASSVDGIGWTSSGAVMSSRAGQWDANLYRPSIVQHSDSAIRLWYSSAGPAPNVGHTVIPLALWPDPPG